MHATAIVTDTALLPRHVDPRIGYADPPGAARARSAFADGNADRRVESANVDIPARHSRDANVDPVAICLLDVGTARRDGWRTTGTICRQAGQGASAVSMWMWTGSGPSSISRPSTRTAFSASPMG